ncbi:MAG: hypothetical protein B5M53_07105 [Candidatus Cloacimonas sp. 4484_209]|nr:MAG: hypothetical protein B5M53_07105 [Candidatus Cloacimonas sp. 4484_209]
MRGETVKINIVVFLLVGIWSFFFLRLGYIQIFRRGYYTEKSNRQSVKKVVVYPERGKIFDRYGKEIATNVESKTIIAFPGEVRDKKRAALLLAKHGFGSFKGLYKEMQKKKFMYIKRNIDEDPPEDIRKIKGIELLMNKKRFYPYGKSFSSVIGFVGTDYTGLEGLEFAFDSLLSGKPGWAVLQKAPNGVLFPHPALPRKSPQSGKNLVLTVDADLQSIVFSELKNVIERTSSKGGVVIVINPKTGEILAMVSLPGFDPNHPLKSDRNTWVNRAISELFEPGSTFKIVAATAAVENKLYNLDDIVEDGEGIIRIGRVKISDAEKHGPLTFVQFVEHSSNVAAIKIAERIGKKRFYCYARSFGFGSRTKIGLPGEEKGYLGSPLHWSPLKFATMSFGQGVSATALQLVFAYAAVANDGILLKPLLVKSIVSNDGDTLFNASPVIVRRVMHKETAQILKQILEGVVNFGTGKYARVDGLEIAGKTGTAQKSNPELGYKKGGYVASFIGFFPVYDPQFLIGVFIDEPKGLHWGGYVAAPLFKKIVQRILCLDNYNSKIPRLLVEQSKGTEANETIKSN